MPKPSPIVHDFHSSGSNKTHFVVSTGNEKADPELRKLIRSHVMKGKNRKTKAGPGKARNKKEAEAEDAAQEDLTTARARVPPIEPPHNFGCYSSSIQLADSVGPGLMDKVLHCKLLRSTFVVRDTE
jgi:hypothetical protein